MIKHINAQSRLPKLDEIKLLIENEDLDIKLMQIKLMQLSNQLNLIYETDSVLKYKF